MSILTSINNRSWSDLLGTHVNAKQALEELDCTLESSESAVVEALLKFEKEVGPTTDYDEMNLDAETKKNCGPLNNEQAQMFMLICDARTEAFARMARDLLRDAAE